MEEYAGSEALDAGPARWRPGRRALRNVALWHAEAWATRLGMKMLAALLDQTLQEERKTDSLRSKLAQAKVD